jgi:hypothetical protein
VKRPKAKKKNKSAKAPKADKRRTRATAPRSKTLKRKKAAAKNGKIKRSGTAADVLKLKPGESLYYHGTYILREEASADKAPYRLVRQISVSIPDPARYRTIVAAKEAVDVLIDDAAKSELQIMINAETREREAAINDAASRRKRNQEQGMSEIGSSFEYRSRIVERVEDDADEIKQYRVEGMPTIFDSVDVALDFIDWSVDSTFEYRSRAVERVDVYGAKPYRVRGMLTMFDSVDMALAFIDWSVDSKIRIDDQEAWDAEAMKRNLEK